MSRIRAFTLIELLIVIAIIAILGSATVVVLNPLELMRQGRDGTRINDTQNIEKALKLTLFNNPTLLDSLSPTNIYLSLPSGSCPSNPPTGYAYVCNAASANLTKIDGTGWIPLSLQNIASLPTDPNSNPNFYYAFVADPVSKTYVVTSLLESEKQLKAAASKSGGYDPSRFEKGSVSLWDKANGLVGYWSFDGTGSIANGQTTGLQDLSGNNNNGIAGNANGTGMGFIEGKIGNGLQLDGVDDYVTVSNTPTLNGLSVATVGAWVKPSSNMYIFQHGSSYNVNGYINTFEITSSGAVYVDIEDASTLAHVSAYSPTNTVPMNSWSYVVTVVRSNTFEFYVNGSKVLTSSTFNGMYPLASCVDLTRNIGRYYYNSTTAVNYSLGIIDDLKIYNRALTADEILSSYNAQK